MTYESIRGRESFFEKFEKVGRPAVRAKWAFRRKQFLEAMDKSNQYRMKYGDGFIGPAFTMTGWEALKKNKALEGKFWIALNTNKNARLGRWVIVDHDEGKS